jgi:type IV pilus assembly protein PilW
MQRIRQHGFTMVELMVAMTLGLLIVLVVAQVFLSSKDSYTAVEQLSRLQENARYSLGQMARVIRTAGYITDPNASRGTVFPSTAMAVDGTEGVSGASDSITVRFQGSGTPTADGTALDCLGNQIAGGNVSVNRYYVATGANGSNSLFCDNTGSVGPAAAAVELVPNVQNMQVLYGEDTNADSAANYYVNRTSVVTADNIVSVRISILFSSNDFVASAADTKTYSLLGTNYTAGGDRRLRRVYTTTMTLRNRVQ